MQVSGAVAQLGERVVRNDEVVGSIPISSTFFFFLSALRAVMFFVYVLKSQTTGRLYTGSTNNVMRRLNEHNSGQTSSTRGRGPFCLALVECYPTREEAVRRERFLKTGKGRDELSLLFNVASAPSLA